MYLGFDVSTTCTGFAAVSTTGALLALEHLSPTSKPGEEGRPFRMGEEFREWVQQVRARFPQEKIDGVFVEEPLISSSNANTCATLLRHNGICAWIAYQETGITPEWLSVRDIRAAVCPELVHRGVLSFPKGLDKQGKKAYIQQKLARWYPTAEWVYMKAKTRRGELASASFDRSDALALTLAGMLRREKLTFLNYGERPEPNISI